MRRSRSPVVLVFAVVLALVGTALLPAWAQAFTVRRFTVADQGGRIVYRVSVCTSGRARVLFHSYLHTEMGIGPTYSRDWSDRKPPGCYRWTLRERDQYSVGQWDAQLRIVVGGRARYTPLRYFEIT